MDLWRICVASLANPTCPLRRLSEISTAMMSRIIRQLVLSAVDCFLIFDHDKACE